VGNGKIESLRGKKRKGRHQGEKKKSTHFQQRKGVDRRGLGRKGEVQPVYRKKRGKRDWVMGGKKFRRGPGKGVVGMGGVNVKIV